MGTKSKWTKQTLAKEAKKYKTRSELRIKSRSAYNAARKLGVMDAICSHMTGLKSWTIENLAKEAKKYTSRNEFYTKSGSAYTTAIRLGVLDDVCSHMVKRNSWTREAIAKESKKYKTRYEFQKESRSAYNTAIKLGILDSVCSHMVCGRKNRKLKWTKEVIKKEAQKYKTRGEFSTKASGAYYAAVRLGILDKVCSHMVSGRKNRRAKWTKKTLSKEAQKYKSRSEFSAKSGGAYNTAIKLGILNSICSHMVCGKTKWTKKTLKEEAKKYNTRKNFSVKSGGAYKAALKMDLLSEICSHMVCGRKNRKNKWTEKTVSKEAQKYKLRSEFKRKAKGAYEAAWRLGIFEKVCSHMVFNPRKSHWTKDTIPKEARKYKSRSEFCAKSSGAYQAARKLGILDKVCSHMKTPELREKRCVYLYIFEDGSYYAGLTYSFKRRHPAHKKSIRFKNKIKNNISYTFEHTDLMHYKEAQKLEKEWIKKYESLGYKKLNKTEGGELGGCQIKWTKVKIAKEAKKYKKRSEFETKAGGAYQAAGRLGILDKVCSHMPKRKRWTKGMLKKEAKKYKKRSEFQKESRSAYDAARKLDIFDEVCSHMPKPKKWSKDKIKKEAKKYKTRGEFETKAGGAYKAAKKLDIFDEVCSHMATRSKDKNNVIKFPSKKDSTHTSKEAA